MKLFFYKTILLCVVLILSACAKSYPVYETEVIRITPPMSLLEPLPVPFFAGSTNEDLLLYTLTLEQNIQLCNNRLESIKKSIEK